MYLIFMAFLVPLRASKERKDPLPLFRLSTYYFLIAMMRVYQMPRGCTRLAGCSLFRPPRKPQASSL